LLEGLHMSRLTMAARTVSVSIERPLSASASLMAALHLCLCHQLAQQLLCDQLDGLAA
jgi:hypothetical protein